MTELKPGDRGYIDPRRYIIYPMVDDMFTLGEVASIRDKEAKERAKLVYSLCHGDAALKSDIVLELWSWLYLTSTGALMLAMFLLDVRNEDAVRFFLPFGATQDNFLVYVVVSFLPLPVICQCIAWLLEKRFFADRRVLAQRKLANLLADQELVSILLTHSPKLLADARVRLK